MTAKLHGTIKHKNFFIATGSFLFLNVFVPSCRGLPMVVGGLMIAFSGFPTKLVPESVSRGAFGNDRLLAIPEQLLIFHRSFLGHNNNPRGCDREAFALQLKIVANLRMRRDHDL